jgi:hypothetical protein
MSCFCDIPLSRIREHTNFYGEYGLGMTKDWGVRNNLEPLLYTTKEGSITQLLNDLIYITEINKNKDTASENKIILDNFKKVIALTKPLSGKMKKGNSYVEKNFHQENEWRFVPKNYKILNKEIYITQKDTIENSFNPKNIDFQLSDINYIFVKTDSEIQIIIDCINNKYNNSNNPNIQILISRIISLETLTADL